MCVLKKSTVKEVPELRHFFYLCNSTMVPGMTAPNTPHIPQKPQAVSHMILFFLLPSILFVGWASYRFVSGVLKPQPRDVFSQLEKMKGSRTAGDRWQAAYGLTQSLQALMSTGDLEKLPDEKKDALYQDLEFVLNNHESDIRIQKYLYLTLGKMGDARGLPAFKKGLQETNSELRFYAAWGFIETLLKNENKITPENLLLIRPWIQDPDPAFRKISSTFLGQKGSTEDRSQILKLLNDQDIQVTWNAAVVLSSVGDSRAYPKLKEIFDLKTLRNANISNAEDLGRIVSAAWAAAQRSKNADLLQAADKLRQDVNPNTPEGRAIQKALAGNPTNIDAAKSLQEPIPESHLLNRNPTQ
jgi:hypothetical protein